MSQALTIKIALIGFGTVGASVLQLLQSNAKTIEHRSGVRFIMTDIAVRNLQKAQQKLASIQEDIILWDDATKMISQTQATIVCELMGGIEEARTYILAAIQAKKHIVTANKALLAVHGEEIFRAAQAQGVVVKFEAAVAGAIPIIKALREGLAANHIQSVLGIMNGTCNYILSAMHMHAEEFAHSLAEAQAKGYAEADPTTDIEGIDAAHKLSLLASIAFGMLPSFSKLSIEGISRIDASDVCYAKKLGYVIKLLGIARQSEGGIELRVHPTLLPEQSVLANVNGSLNAVMVMGNYAGQTVYTGAGAGGEATASSVVADLVDASREIHLPESSRLPFLGVPVNALKPLPIIPMAEVSCCHYLRIPVDDEPGVLADIARALADENISIDTMLQPKAGDHHTDIVIVTHHAKDADVAKAMQRINSFAKVCAGGKRMRVESL